MPCKEVKAKAYQTRKSPAFHAGQCKGETKEGKDGTYISKADSRGIFKWMRKTRKQKKNGPDNMSASYDIHWNGARPYTVEINDGLMSVFRNGDEGKKLVFETTFKTLWVPHGGGPKGGFNQHDPRELGNTLLAYIKGNQYIHVGDGILRILIQEPVLGFYSELIANDIPEPYIYTEKSVIIMNDYKVYPKSILLDPTEGIFSPANEGIETRKVGQGKKLGLKRLRSG
jgi:hypothetical protein